MTLFFQNFPGGACPKPSLECSCIVIIYPIRHPLPHSKCTVTIILVLYIIKINYLLILYIKNGQNLIKLYTKIHQIASYFYKNFRGVCPRSPEPLQLDMQL